MPHVKNEKTRKNDRDKKRRKRAAYYAMGLTCFGKPRKKRASAALIGAHPSDCTCYDCLWGSK